MIWKDWSTESDAEEFEPRTLRILESNRMYFRKGFNVESLFTSTARNPLIKSARHLLLESTIKSDKVERTSTLSRFSQSEY